MPQFNDTELTAAVVKSFEETPDPRVKFLMEELVKALHGFVRKTDLSFDEWAYAIDFLTRVGQKCWASRQEFILPCSYPIPTDGPVGQMILQTRRHPNRPAHIHFLVDAPGHEPLVTHVFIEGDKYLDSDVVFGVKNDLVSRVEKCTDQVMPDGKPAEAPWHLMTYEFRMKPGQAAAPKPRMAATEDA